MKIKEFIKNYSLLPQGVRYKLLIAFCLMSIIPLLVIGYLVNNFIMLEVTLTLGQVSLVVLFCVVIAWLGLYLAKGIVERVVDMALEAKTIMEGNYEQRIAVQTGDEIGQIGDAINFLAKKIKSNIADLKSYQDKMKEINIDIQKRVSVLANLLQIGELITSGVKMDAVLELILSKLSFLYESGFALLYSSQDVGKRFVLRTAHNVDTKELLEATIEEGRGFLGKAILKKRYAVMDSSSKFSSNEQEFKTKYKCENVIAYPMAVARGIKLLLVVGNNLKNFTFTNDDIEVLKVFAEQVSIAIENDILIRAARKLEIKDERTGLFNRAYIIGRLKEEIQRSVVSQRPCSFILFDVDDFRKYREKKGNSHAEEALKKIAAVVCDLSLPVGKPAMIEDDTFALLLPEANKKEALETAEKIRKRIEKMALSSEKGDSITASAGVSENPLDGSTVEQIFEKAESALKKAKQKGKNKVIGFGV